MPWDDIARRDHARRGKRYASDLTDREWALIAPFLPRPGARDGPAARTCERLRTRSSTLRRAAVSGGSCQRTFRRRRPCSGASTTRATADLAAVSFARMVSTSINSGLSASSASCRIRRPSFWLLPCVAGMRARSETKSAQSCSVTSLPPMKSMNSEAETPGNCRTGLR
jgi:hypothetical protein